MLCPLCNNVASIECSLCGKLFCNNCCDVLCKNCSKPEIKDDEVFIYKGSLVLLLIASVFFTWFIFDNQKLLNDHNKIEQNIIIDSTNEIKKDSSKVITLPPPVTVSIPIPSLEENNKSSKEEEAEKKEPKYQIYTVEEGDSLYAIAMQYIVLGEDIDEYLTKVAELNNIINPNDIQIGQKIRIPVQ